jgi:nitrate reductase NapE component
MVFVLYKHNDNEILFTGVYENENDAIEIKNLHNDDSFKIMSLVLWKNTINKDTIVYNEEDNNINESDVELTPQFRKRRRIYAKELMKDVKDVKSYENDKREYNIYTYMVLACIIVLFFILNILLVGFHYMLYHMLYHIP